MLSATLAALAGLVAGRLLRVAVPAAAGLEDRNLPFSFPWMELAGGLAFTLLELRFGHQPAAWPWFVLAALLLLISAIDLRVKLIPDILSYPGAGLGLVLSALAPTRIEALFGQGELLRLVGLGEVAPALAGALLALWGATLGFLALELVRLSFRLWAGTEVMGRGDAKLMLVIGAFLGPATTLFALLLSFPIGVVLGSANYLIRRQHHLAFGPALAAAALVVPLAGDRILAVLETSQHHLMARPLWQLGLLVAVLLVVLAYFLRRLRSRAAQYREEIEEDYREIDRELL